MTTLAGRLRMLRKACGLTLADVSSTAGISLSFLSDVERGRTPPSLETLQRLADVYELTLSELLIGVRVATSTSSSERSARDVER